jgi:hypothetical protein
VGRKNSTRIRRTALPEAELDQAARAVENPGRELVAVLAGHCPLDSVADGRDRTSIVLELSVLCDSPAPSRLLPLQRECSISSD